MKFLHPIFSATLVLIFLATSHVYSNPISDRVEISPCNPISMLTCSLPYPSDWVLKEDSLGKKRLSIPEGFVREALLKEVPPTLTPQTVFNGSDGFSAITSVLFELDSAPDESTLPLDGGESLLAFDLDSGKRIPVRVKMNDYARSDLVSAPSEVIEVLPVSRWQFSHRYVVLLTHNLKDKSGQPYKLSKGFEHALTPPKEILGTGNAHEIYNYHKPLRNFLDNNNIAPSHLLSAVFFTIRSEENVTRPLKTMTNLVLTQPHPIRNIDTTYYPIGPVAVTVTGEVKIYNFRDQYGKMDFESLKKGSKGKPQWVPFLLHLPNQARSKKVPVSIYGHGLGATKESNWLVVLGNADLGIATASIGQPNHGARAEADGGHVFDRLETRYAPIMMGMITQSTVDFMSLYRALETSLSELDVLSETEDKADGVPEINGEFILYQGTSLGGVFGSTFAALAPNLKGAFLQVAGAGITNILSLSILWEGTFSQIEPKEANGAEAMLLKAGIQHEMDYGDGINYLHYYRNPPKGVTERPIAIQIGRGDGIVPTFSSQAFVSIVDLPLVGEQLFPMEVNSSSSQFVDGYGVVQSLPLFDIGLFEETLGHISFLRPNSITLMRSWLTELVKDQ